MATNPYIIKSGDMSREQEKAARERVRQFNRASNRRIRRILAMNFSWGELKTHSLWYIAYRSMYKLRALIARRSRA